MSKFDALLNWFDSPGAPTHVAVIMRLRPGGDDAEFARRLVEAWRAYPATNRPFNYLFKSRPKPLSGTWETTTEVDMDYHVRHAALPSPGGQRELGVFISRLHSLPLDPQRPPWEVHVIEGFEGTGVVVYVKAHHVLFEFSRGLRMIVETFVTQPSTTSPPPPWSRTDLDSAAPPTDPGVLERVRDTTTKLPAAASTFVIDAMRAKKPLTGPVQAPESALNVGFGPERRVSTGVVELARVKSVAKSNRTTVNAVVLAMLSAALRRYFEDIEMVPSQSLTAMCPVTADAKPQTDGNAECLIFANLATDVKDPLARLAAIKTSTQPRKNQLKSPNLSVLSDYATLAGAPQLIKQFVPDAAEAGPMANLTITHVRGPEKTLYAAGGPVSEIYLVAALPKNEALTVTILSYAGNLHFGFTANHKALPHVQKVAGYAVEALAELETVRPDRSLDIGRLLKSMWRWKP